MLSQSSTRLPAQQNQIRNDEETVGGERDDSGKGPVRSFNVTTLASHERRHKSHD
jgi:hypothetical protein